MSGSGLSASKLEALIARARQELPEPGDPRRLMDDFLEADLAGPEALEVLNRTTLAWVQLRDMRLERSWQSGYGWFLARNAMALGFLILLALTLGEMNIIVVQAILIGIVAYYLLVCALAPLRVRRHKHRRLGILENYGEDLGQYLDEIASS